MNDFQFSEPWHKTSEEDVNLLDQLNRELSEGHPLFGKQVELLARRFDMDDILLKVDDKYAVVHLTWSDQPQIDPRFPATSFYNSIREAVTEDQGITLKELILSNSFINKLRLEFKIDEDDYSDLCWNLKLLAEEWKGKKEIDKEIMQDIYIIPGVIRGQIRPEYTEEQRKRLEEMEIEIDALILECLAN